MKKSIKIISAIIAFVFTIEQIAYPAPYSALRAPASKNAESKDDFPRTLEEDPPIIKYLSETPPKEQVERLEKILKHHQPLTAAQEAEIKKLINIWKAAISEDQVGEASPDEAFPSGAFNRVRFAWYPTGEFDLKTAHELLKIFPDLSEFVYVDLYQHLTEKAFLREVGTQIEKHNLDFKIKNCRAEGPLTSEGGLDTDGRFVVEVESSSGRTITFRFCNGEALSFTYPERKKFDLCVVNCPGELGSLSKNPKFYTNVIQNLRVNGCLFVRRAFEPLMTMQGASYSNRHYARIGLVKLYDEEVAQKLPEASSLFKKTEEVPPETISKLIFQSRTGPLNDPALADATSRASQDEASRGSSGESAFPAGLEKPYYSKKHIRHKDYPEDIPIRLKAKGRELKIVKDKNIKLLAEALEIPQAELLANLNEAIKTRIHLAREDISNKDLVRLARKTLRIRFCSTSPTLMGDDRKNNIITINLDAQRHLRSKHKRLAVIMLGIGITHELLGHEIGRDNENALTEEDVELFNLLSTEHYILLKREILNCRKILGEVINKNSKFYRGLESIVGRYWFLTPSKRFRLLRKALGLTRKQVGVKQRYVSEMERGIKPIPKNIFTKLETKYIKLSPERFKSLRERLGFSQRKLAKILGVLPGTVTSWETGKRPISGSTLIRLMEIYEQFTLNKLRFLVDRCGLTYKDLAKEEMLGVDKGTISRRTKGMSLIPENMLPRIKKIYKDAALEKFKFIENTLDLTQGELLDRLGVSIAIRASWIKRTETISEDIFLELEKIYKEEVLGKIEFLIEIVGIAQSELVERLGIYPRTIYWWKQPESTIPEDVFDEVNKIYRKLASKRFKYLRELLGFEKKLELANELDVDPSLISLYENGQRLIPEYMFYELRKMYEKLRPKFPEVLKSMREALGLTQAELAKELGVTIKQVRKWEKGKPIIPDEKLIKLREIYNELSPGIYKSFVDALGLSKKLGIVQGDLAKKLKTTVHYISVWKKGIQSVPPEKLIKLREVYKELSPKMFKSLKEALGLSQRKLGRKLGVSKSAISQYENGITPIPPDKLIKLRKIYASQQRLGRTATDGGGLQGEEETFSATPALADASSGMFDELWNIAKKAMRTFYKAVIRQAIGYWRSDIGSIAGEDEEPDEEKDEHETLAEFLEKAGSARGELRLAEDMGNKITEMKGKLLAGESDILWTTEDLLLEELAEEFGLTVDYVERIIEEHDLQDGLSEIVDLSLQITHKFQNAHEEALEALREAKIEPSSEKIVAKVAELMGMDTPTGRESVYAKLVNLELIKPIRKRGTRIAYDDMTKAYLKLLVIGIGGYKKIAKLYRDRGIEVSEVAISRAITDLGLRHMLGEEQTWNIARLDFLLENYNESYEYLTSRLGVSRYAIKNAKYKKCGPADNRISIPNEELGKFYEDLIKTIRIVDKLNRTEMIKAIADILHLPINYVSRRLGFLKEKDYLKISLDVHPKPKDILAIIEFDDEEFNRRWFLENERLEQLYNIGIPISPIDEDILIRHKKRTKGVWMPRQRALMVILNRFANWNVREISELFNTEVRIDSIFPKGWKMVRRTDTAAIPNMCHWRYIATGPLGKPALAEKFDIPEDIVDSIKEKYAKMGKEKVEKQEKQDYSDLIKNIATINLLPTQDDYIHAVANITDLPEDYVKERFADLNITIAQDFLLDERKLKLKESYLKRIERQSAKYIKTRIRKVKKKKKSGSRFFSRPIILGLVLLVFMSLSPLGFSQPRSDQQQSQFSGLNELGLQEKTERGIENLTIRHRNALYADLLNRSFVHIEDVLDYYPLQESLVRKGIRLEMPFELDDGLIYHGNYDLDKILLANQAEGELFFTRIPYAWATGSFNETSKSPAIFVMDTKVFNDLANNGYAALDYEVFDLHGNRVRVLDPYPNASVFSIDQVKEIWVSEDTYGRYQRIISAEEASGLPIEDRPLMAIQDTLRHFLESGKIRRIPRLRHAQLSYSTPEERLATYAEVYRIVSNYMKKRDLFQHMPFFKLVGEESPFMNVNKKALIRRAWRLRSLRNAPLWILLGMAILSGPAILLWHRRSERKRRDAERRKRRLARQKRKESVAEEGKKTQRVRPVVTKKKVRLSPAMTKQVTEQIIFIIAKKITSKKAKKRITDQVIQQILDNPTRPGVSKALTGAGVSPTAGQVSEIVKLIDEAAAQGDSADTRSRSSPTTPPRHLWTDDALLDTFVPKVNTLALGVIPGPPIAGYNPALLGRGTGGGSRGSHRKTRPLTGSEKVRLMREALGFTKKEFAEELGVSVNTLSRWEDDAIPPEKLKAVRQKHRELTPNMVKSMRVALGLTQGELGGIKGIDAVASLVSVWEKPYNEKDNRSRIAIPPKKLIVLRQIYRELTPNMVKSIREILDLTEEELGELEGIDEKPHIVTYWEMPYNKKDRKAKNTIPPEKLIALRQIYSERAPEFTPEMVNSISEILDLSQEGLGALEGIDVERHTVSKWEMEYNEDKEESKLTIPLRKLIVLWQIYSEHARKFTPEMVKSMRVALGLTPGELGDYEGIDVDAGLVSQWEMEYNENKEESKLTIPLKKFIFLIQMYRVLTPNMVKSMREALGFNKVRLGGIKGIDVKGKLVSKWEMPYDEDDEEAKVTIPPEKLIVLRQRYRVLTPEMVKSMREALDFTEGELGGIEGIDVDAGLVSQWEMPYKEDDEQAKVTIPPEKLIVLIQMYRVLTPNMVKSMREALGRNREELGDLEGIDVKPHMVTYWEKPYDKENRQARITIPPEKLKALRRRYEREVAIKESPASDVLRSPPPEESGLVDEDKKEDERNHSYLKSMGVAATPDLLDMPHETLVSYVDERVLLPLLETDDRFKKELLVPFFNASRRGTISPRAVAFNRIMRLARLRPADITERLLTILKSGAAGSGDLQIAGNLLNFLTTDAGRALINALNKDGLKLQKVIEEEEDEEEEDERVSLKRQTSRTKKGTERTERRKDESEPLAASPVQKQGQGSPKRGPDPLHERLRGFILRILQHSRQPTSSEWLEDVDSAISLIADRYFDFADAGKEVIDLQTAFNRAAGRRSEEESAEIQKRRDLLEQLVAQLVIGDVEPKPSSRAADITKGLSVGFAFGFGMRELMPEGLVGDSAFSSILLALAVLIAAWVVLGVVFKMMTDSEFRQRFLERLNNLKEMNAWILREFARRLNPLQLCPAGPAIPTIYLARRATAAKTRQSATKRRSKTESRPRPTQKTNPVAILFDMLYSSELRDYYVSASGLESEVMKRTRKDISGKQLQMYLDILVLAGLATRKKLGKAKTPSYASTIVNNKELIRTLRKRLASIKTGLDKVHEEDNSKNKIRRAARKVQAETRKAVRACGGKVEVWNQGAVVTVVDLTKRDIKGVQTDPIKLLLDDAVKSDAKRHQDILYMYISEIAKIPFLTKKEEKKLLWRLRLFGDNDARTVLIYSNLPFVVSRVNKAIRKELAPSRLMLDLIQEGNIGLIEAVDRFDAGVDSGLRTYARHYIDGYIMMYAKSNWHQVDLSRSNKDHLKKWQERCREIGIDLYDASISAEEIVRRLKEASYEHVPFVATIKDYRQVGAGLRYMPLDHPDVSRKLGISPPQEVLLQRKMQEENMDVFVERLLEVLEWDGNDKRSERARRILPEVVKAYWAEETKSLPGIGNIVGVTGESIRLRKDQILIAAREVIDNAEENGDVATIDLFGLGDGRLSGLGLIGLGSASVLKAVTDAGLSADDASFVSFFAVMAGFFLAWWGLHLMLKVFSRTYREGNEIAYELVKERFLERWDNLKKMGEWIGRRFAYLLHQQQLQPALVGVGPDSGVTAISEPPSIPNILLMASKRKRRSREKASRSGGRKSKPHHDIYSCAKYVLTHPPDAKNVVRIAISYFKYIVANDRVRDEILKLTKSNVKRELENLRNPNWFILGNEKERLKDRLKGFSLEILMLCRDKVSLAESIVVLEDALKVRPNDDDIQDLYDLLWKSLDELIIEELEETCLEILSKRLAHKNAAMKLAKKYWEINEHDSAIKVLEGTITALKDTGDPDDARDLEEMRDSVIRAKTVLEEELNPRKRFNKERYVSRYAVPDGNGGYFVDTFGFPGDWDITLSTKEPVHNAALFRFVKSLSKISDEIKNSELSIRFARHVDSTNISFGRIDVVDGVPLLQFLPLMSEGAVKLDIAVSRDFLYKRYGHSSVKEEIDAQRQAIREALTKEKLSVKKKKGKRIRIDEKPIAYSERPKIALVSLSLMTSMGIESLQDSLIENGIDSVATRRFWNHGRMDEFMDGLLSAPELNRESPDIIGLSVTISDIEAANTLIGKLRVRFPDAFIFIGGPCAQTAEQFASLVDDFDFMMRGEGKDLLPQAVSLVGNSKRREGLSPEKIRRLKQDPVFKGGIMARFGNNIIIRDLAHTNEAKELHLVKPRGKFSIHPWMTSMGCVHNCNFCSLIKGRGYRLLPATEMRDWLIERLALQFNGDKDPSDLEAELTRAKDANEVLDIPGLAEKIRIFFFDDDPILGSRGRERMIEFCDYVTELGLENYFEFCIMGANINSFYGHNGIYTELIDKMRLAGFRRIILGTDGFTQAIVDQNDKGYSFEKRVIPLNKYLREQGFIVWNNSIVATPYTTAKQLLEEYILFMTYVIFPTALLTPAIIMYPATTFVNREIVNNSQRYTFCDTDDDDHGHYSKQKNHRVPKQFWEYSLVDYSYIPYSDPAIEKLLLPVGTYFFPQLFQKVFSEEEFWEVTEGWHLLDEEEHPELAALGHIFNRLKKKKMTFEEALMNIHQHMSGLGILSYTDYWERFRNGRIEGQKEEMELHSHIEDMNNAMGEKDVARAMEAFNRIKTLKSDFIAAYNAIANFLVIMGQVSEGIRIYSDGFKILTHQNRYNYAAKQLDDRLKTDFGEFGEYGLVQYWTMTFYFLIAKLEETLGLDHVESVNVIATHPYSLEIFESIMLTLNMSMISDYFDKHGDVIREKLASGEEFELFGITITTSQEGERRVINLDIKQKDGVFASAEPDVAAPQPTIVDTAKATEEAKLRELVPKMEDRIKVYGIGWLIENGEYGWDKENGLMLAGPGAGDSWTECSTAAELVGDMLLRNGINGWLVPISLSQKLYLGSARKTALSTDHVVVLTDNGFVIDLTGWNHMFKEKVPYIELERYPFRESVEFSIKKGLPKRIREFNHRTTVVKYLYLLNKERGLRATIDLPVNFKALDSKRSLSSNLGLGFCKDREGKLQIIFSYQVSYNIYRPAERAFVVPQGLVISSTISAEKFFALQPKIKELLESRDPDEMLRFIGSMDSDFDSVVLPDNHPQDLHGSPDMIKQVMHKAKNDFYLFFTFMSKIPPISSDELAQLVERASVQLSFRQIVGRKFPLDTLDPQELDTERDPPATGSGNFAEFIDDPEALITGKLESESIMPGIRAHRPYSGGSWTEVSPDVVSRTKQIIESFQATDSQKDSEAQPIEKISHSLLIEQAA